MRFILSGICYKFKFLSYFEFDFFAKEFLLRIAFDHWAFIVVAIALINMLVIHFQLFLSKKNYFWLVINDLVNENLFKSY